MASEDKELMALGAQPHDDELAALGAISPEDQAKVEAYMKQPEVPLMESARAGLASGGTYGFAPRIGAAGGALASKAQQSLSGEPQPQSLKDLYNEYLKYNNERQAKAHDANPWTYGTMQFAGGLASPLNKITSIGAPLTKTASIPLKMAEGALKGTELGAVGGASQSPDLTNPQATAQNALMGAALGTGIGAAAPPIIGAAKALGTGAANLAKPLIGEPGELFQTGRKMGRAGLPKLSGEPGQLQATDESVNFADQFVQDVHRALSSDAKNKRELIAQALEKSQLSPQEAVQAISQKYLDANPKLNEESARKELAELREMFLTAREGPLKTETVRQYINPADKPPVASAVPNIPLGPVERGTMVPPSGPDAMPLSGAPGQAPPQLGPSQMPQPGQPINMPGAPPMTAPPIEPSVPTEFSGYEAVHKATIDPEDEEAMEAFHHKVNEKLADERALGKDVNENPVEMHQEPIEGSDQVRMVARRAVTEENPDAFKDQAENLVKQQKEQIKAQTEQQKQAQKLQDLLDKQQEEANKQKQQQETEMAKPQFQDIQQQVREGGRNLQDPAELYQLYKNLQAKSQFSEGRGFSSQEMNKMSGDAAKDIAQLIKATIPETVPIDQRLTAFNNVAESLGINTDKLQLPGGEGQKARQDAMKKVLGVLTPEVPNTKSKLNQNSIDYVTQQLNKVHPDIGEAFQQEAQKHAENAATINALNQPGTVGGGGPILSAVRRGVNKTAYNIGYGLGDQANKFSKDIEPIQKIFQSYTPQALQDAAGRAAQSSNQAMQQMGQVLSKLAQADDRTRNAMMFALEQNAGYRDMMTSLFPKETPKTPQAKDKTLQKYK